MSARPCSGVSLVGPSGVRGAARDHSSARNRRDPSGRPSSGKDPRYKPMVKSEGGQRESDGVVVPVIGVMNAPGGKGPDFGHASCGGKRKGMAGTARSNYPDRTPSVDNVRKLQRKLWAAAKQSEDRRFHALFDRVCRGDVLQEAWRRVLRNRGAAGVDRQSLEDVQGYGVDRMLRELSLDLREGRYRPAPARRVEIPKPRGGTRWFASDFAAEIGVRNYPRLSVFSGDPRGVVYARVRQCPAATDEPVGGDEVGDLSAGHRWGDQPGSNCQHLWIKIFYAASSVVVSSSGRSTSLPFSNRAPARTSATRWGALIARQRDWAASISL
jgi:hypothetical protein